MSLHEDLRARLAALDGVECRKSRFSGATAFYLGRREIAHFHGDEVLDIRLTRGGIRALDEDPRLRTRGSSDWAEFTFAEAGDVPRAVELVQLAVERNAD